LYLIPVAFDCLFTMLLKFVAQATHNHPINRPERSDRYRLIDDPFPTLVPKYGIHILIHIHLTDVSKFASRIAASVDLIFFRS
jgi:hypothetical protein